MNRIKYLILVIICLFGLTMLSYSQPTAILHLTGGYSLPVGSMRGTFGSNSSSFMTNNPDTDSYYMKVGYGYGLTLSKAFGKDKHFAVTAGLLFNLFHQNVDYNTSTDSTAKSISLKMNITTVSLGAEWFFLPKNRHLCPFVGATFDANIYSGSLTSTLLLSTTTNTQNLWGQLRFGVTLNAGIDFPIQQNVGFVIGTKYYITNLIGKNSQTNDLIHYGLNDASRTTNDINLPARTISFLHFYGGISFYFGR